VVETFTTALLSQGSEENCECRCNTMRIVDWKACFIHMGDEVLMVPVVKALERNFVAVDVSCGGDQRATGKDKHPTTVS
jgi:hypothetical protein